MKKRKIFSLLLCLTLMLTCIFMTSCSKNGVAVEIEDEITTQARPIELKKMRLANTAEQGVVVTAIVNPNEVINDKLNWTLEWVSTSSEKVSDYVTMQVSADTHSVTLTYVKNFNKQLILKATSVLTPTINSTCTIDCYKRTTDFNLDFAFETSDYDDFIPTTNNAQKTIDFSGLKYSMLDDVSICDCDLINIISTGTVNVTNVKLVKFSLSQELKTKLVSAGITTNQYYDLINPENYAESIYELLTELITITSSNREQVFKILGTVNYWFDMTCTVNDMFGTTEVNSLTKVYKMQGFNIADGLSVTSVNLNKTTIIF